MERNLRIPAIVVRHLNYEETDRIITFLTPNQGKLTALARGVRKIGSRKAGHLQPFTYLNLQLVHGKGAMWLVDQAATIEAFPGLTRDIDRTARAAYLLELAEKFAPEESSAVPLFQLTLDCLRRMAGTADAFSVQRYFDLQLLSVAGYRPQLHRCVGCTKPIQAEEQFFNFLLGGVMCPTCGEKIPEARRLTLRALKFLRYYQTRDAETALAAPIPADLHFELESLLTYLETTILEHKLNSQRFLEHIRS